MANDEPTGPSAPVASEASAPPPTAAAASPATLAPPHVASQALPSPAASSTDHASAPPPPALQVAQAIVDPVHVILAAPPQQANEPHVTTIQLDPAELGRVEIRIERTGDGPAKVELAAERPETLLRLVHDQPQLQQALDQAGIPQHGRTITFSLASDNGGNGSSFANSAGGGTFNGNGQRSQQGYGNPNASTIDATDTLLPTPAWNRTGLDITA